ncbi:putative retrotransposon gag domain-containing protein [Helianthus anomalus]
MTRNQEVDNTLKSHDKAIADIQTALAALMKQQEQSSKQQEEILKVVRDKGVQSSGSSFGSFSGPDGDSRTAKPFRIGKIDFPKFSGDDVEGWVYRCEHFFSMDDTPDHSKLRCAAVHLEGDALQWHRAYLKNRNATVAKVPWADYVRSISARFSDAMFEDPMEEIASLVQLTDNAKGLQEYNSGFDRLLNKVTVSEPYVVSLYLKGLKPEIKGPVKMFKPQTLREAYGLARIQTMSNTCLMKRFKAVEDGLQPKDVKITPPVNGSKLPLLPSPTTEPSSSTPGILRSRRLTSDELEQKRAKGECFWCTERFVPGHKCKKKQLYILEVVDDEKQATEEDEDKVP